MKNIKGFQNTVHNKIKKQIKSKVERIYAETSSSFLNTPLTKKNDIWGDDGRNFE